MSAILATRVLSYTVGIFLSGVAVSVSGQTLVKHGLSADIRRERRRQTIGNFVCLLGSIFALCSYYLLQTRSSVSGLTAMIFLVFACIHVMLAILIHNLIMRIAWLCSKSKLDRNKFSSNCLPVYLLPFVTLIPAFLAIGATSGEGLPMMFSRYHIMVLRPLTFALVALVGLSTTITDGIFLGRIRRLYSFLSSRDADSHVGQIETSDQRMMRAVLNNTYLNYGIVSIAIIVDLVIKCCAMVGVPVLFDNMCTLLWMTLVCRVNLKYGLTLQKIIRPGLELTTSLRRPEARGREHREVVIIEAL